MQPHFTKNEPGKKRSQQEQGRGNQRLSILQARAVEDKRISNSQFRTLAALGLFGDRDGWCWPKLSTLAAILGKSKQAISRDILALKDMGYVEIYHQYRQDGSLTNNKYRLIFDTPYQHDVDTLSTPDVDTLSTSEVDTLSTSEVDAGTPQLNVPMERPRENNPLAPKEHPTISLWREVVKPSRLSEKDKSTILEGLGEEPDRRRLETATGQWREKASEKNWSPTLPDAIIERYLAIDSKPSWQESDQPPAEILARQMYGENWEEEITSRRKQKENV